MSRQPSRVRAAPLCQWRWYLSISSYRTQLIAARSKPAALAAFRDSPGARGLLGPGVIWRRIWRALAASSTRLIFKFTNVVCATWSAVQCSALSSVSNVLNIQALRRTFGKNQHGNYLFICISSMSSQAHPVRWRGSAWLVLVGWDRHASDLKNLLLLFDLGVGGAGARD